MLLDVADGSLLDGGQVRLWPANGAFAQLWRVSHDSQGYVTFLNMGSGKALDVMYASSAMTSSPLWNLRTEMGG
ncbi:MAG: RICIN domain-containing protein [Bifidobacterium sp.]|jgi:hypothetical protein|nr:RICIN domain-containing protein [Bifidobacterium sp.]